jgi:hypothetical protein
LWWQVRCASYSLSDVKAKPANQAADHETASCTCRENKARLFPQIVKLCADLRNGGLHRDHGNDEQDNYTDEADEVDYKLSHPQLFGIGLDFRGQDFGDLAHSGDTPWADRLSLW